MCDFIFIFSARFMHVLVSAIIAILLEISFAFVLRSLWYTMHALTFIMASILLKVCLGSSFDNKLLILFKSLLWLWFQFPLICFSFCFVITCIPMINTFTSVRFRFLFIYLGFYFDILLMLVLCQVSGRDQIVETHYYSILVFLIY